MKLVKLFNKLSAVALAASLVVGFASCSTTTDDPFNPNAPLTLEEYVKSEIKKAIENGGAQAKPEDPSKPGKPSGSGSLKEPKSLEFHVNANSTNAENTMIFVKYDRSAYGAEEEVKVTDAELNLYINDVKVKTYNEIVFVLDEYGAEITSRGPIEDPKAMKEYKAKLSVGKAVKSGETVKIELVKASVVKVGAASDKITLANLQFALIDTDESVKYYKELAPNAEQFQNICTLEDLTTGEDTESKPGEEQKPGENPTPTPDEKPEPGEEETPEPGEKPEPGKTPGEEYEAGNSTVTSIELVKNEYTEGGALQTQVKIQSGLNSLLVGDKVKVAFKGTADREIGKVELMIVDTTETASWWTALSETKKDNFLTEINFDFEFEITKAPIGTGADSMVLAINGLDSDEAATITCTSFSIEKNADKKPAGGEEPTPTPGEEPTPTPGEEPAPAPGEEPAPTPDPEPTPAPGEEPTPAPGEEETPEPGEVPTPTPEPEPEDSGLLSKAADLDWGTPVSVAGSSFASATDDSSIKITYVSNADNDYHKFKMMCGDGNENELFEGEATGFTIDTTSESLDNLHGCGFDVEPSETPVVITYKPSPAEWTKIKDGEFRLIGHGAKITKIELGTAAGGENNAGGEGDNGAGESTSKTYGLCKKYTVTTTKDVAAGDFAFVLQIDNDGEQSADGLKIDVTDFEMEVQVGEEEPFTYKNPKISMIPNEYSSPKFEKTDCRFVLDGVKTIPAKTVITVQVKKATVSNKEKADSIIYVFNEDGANGSWDQYVAPSDNYKSIFAANEI